MLTFLLSIGVMLAVSCQPSYAQDKSLIIVFSRADENYAVGYVDVGNTMKMAQAIAQKTASELFELQPASKYPANYEECINVARKEQNNNSRPAFLQDIDISDYNVIFLGYPIWWGDIPMCLYTFIEAHDWEGKKIFPFCTHEGSGSGRTENTLKHLMPNASISKPLAVRGSVAQKAGNKLNITLNKWLRSLDF